MLSAGMLRRHCWSICEDDSIFFVGSVGIVCFDVHLRSVQCIVVEDFFMSDGQLIKMTDLNMEMC